MYISQLRSGISKINSLIIKTNTLHLYNVLSLTVEKHNLNERICAARNVRQLSTTSSVWKDKNRGKEKAKPGIPKKLDTSELETVLDVDELRADFEQQLDQLKEDFLHHTSLRTTAGSLESLKIKHKNHHHTLDELARISRKAKEVILDLSVNPEAMPNVIEALRSSQMRLNPRADGHTIFVPIPKVTKEYRENLTKAAKAFCQKHCGHIKDVRNANIKIIKEDTNIPKDKSRRLEQTIDTLSKMYMQQAEQMLDTKQKELNKNME